MTDEQSIKKAGHKTAVTAAPTDANTSGQKSGHTSAQKSAAMPDEPIVTSREPISTQEPDTPTAQDAPTAQIRDTPPRSVRDFNDVLQAVICLLLAAAVILVASFLQSSTQGVESDVHRVSQLASIHWVVELPISFLQSFSFLLIVTIVLVRLLLARAWWPTLAATVALGASLAVSGLLTWLLPMGLPYLHHYFSAPPSDLLGVGPIELFTAVAGFLIAAGNHRSSKSLGWAWNWYAVLMVIEVLASTLQLPSALFSVLLGCAIGLLVRFGFGSPSTGAWGQELVDALAGVGVHVDKLSLQKGAQERTSFSDDLTDSSRLYHARTVDGERLTVSVVDAQQHSRGYLSQVWQRLKLQGLSTRQDRTVRDAVEHHLLMLRCLSALRLPVPQVRVMGDTGESSFLVFESPDKGRHAHLLELTHATDEQAAQLMRELEKAHRHGITHRAITSDDIGVIPDVPTTHDETIAVTHLTRAQLLAGATPGADTNTAHAPDEDSTAMGGRAVLDGWAEGDVASSRTNILVDRVQLLTLLAVKIGVERTMQAARTVYSDESLAGLAPYFQQVVIPTRTRHEPQWNRQVLKQMHDACSALAPQTATAEAAPVQFARFSWKKIVTLVLLLVAIVAVFTQLNFDEMLTTIRTANPWWALASLGLGVVSWLGSALAFGIFIPRQKRKGHWAGIVGTQAVASFTAVSMPTAAGPLTVNTLFLRKIGFDNTSAIATSTTDTVAEFATTLLMFLVLGLFTGRNGLENALPGKTILIVVGVLAAIIALVMLVPPWRRWVVAKWGKPVKEYGRQILELFSHPKTLAISALGSVIQNTTLAAAFWVCLLAFGYRLDFIVTLFLFLLSNAIGSAVPTPGGLGAVETVVSVTFMGVGVPSSTAVSATLLFRLMTYWIRMLLGYIYMKWMQHHNYL
jgi:uncharacterized membrane protein YbhN (UPF0104 family)